MVTSSWGFCWPRFTWLRVKIERVLKFNSFALVAVELFVVVVVVVEAVVGELVVSVEVLMVDWGLLGFIVATVVLVDLMLAVFEVVFEVMVWGGLLVLMVMVRVLEVMVSLMVLMVNLLVMVLVLMISLLVLMVSLMVLMVRMFMVVKFLFLIEVLKRNRLILLKTMFQRFVQLFIALLYSVVFQNFLVLRVFHLLILRGAILLFLVI